MKYYYINKNLGGIKMNNIFKFAPSELVFDAFVCWTLNFFNEGNFEERKYSEEFINLTSIR